jgi:hypothetical protein
MGHVVQHPRTFIGDEAAQKFLSEVLTLSNQSCRTSAILPVDLLPPDKFSVLRVPQSSAQHLYGNTILGIGRLHKMNEGTITIDGESSDLSGEPVTASLLKQVMMNKAFGLDRFPLHEKFGTRDVLFTDIWRQ